MNYFESELRKIIKKSNIISDANFISNTCIFRLSDIVTGKIEIAENGTKDNYSILRISLINRTSGIIDTQKIHFSDIIGKIAMNGQNIRPYIWVCRDEIEWYGFTPTNEHYTKIELSIDSYLSMFTEPAKSRSNKTRKTQKDVN